MSVTPKPTPPPPPPIAPDPRAPPRPALARSQWMVQLRRERENRQINERLRTLHQKQAYPYRDEGNEREADDRRQHRLHRCWAPSVSNDALPNLSANMIGPPLLHVKDTDMGIIATKDGTQIFYKDWGSGQPIVFSHGWPLTADDWDAQMLFFGQRGFRVIAHDRRGHGRSTQTWDGNEMDTYADDVAALLDALDVKNAVMIGHSTGGGEVTRYLGRHGTKRVAKAAIVGAVPPLMLKTAANPGGLPMEVFDGIRAGVVKDRSQTYMDITIPFYGYNRGGAAVSQGVRDKFWLQGMMGGVKPQYDCIKAFSETDFTEDLKKIDIPVLVMHGDDDQIVPIGASAHMSAKLLPKPTLKVYPGFPHGMCTVNADTINEDLLAFIKA